MPKFHVVTLDEVQRLLLEKTVRSGTASTRTVTRARILLKSDTGEFGPGWIDTEIADALNLGLSTVERTRKIIEWLEATARAWNREPTPFEWGGKRQARRTRARKRRHTVGGSGACTRRPLQRRRAA